MYDGVGRIYFLGMIQGALCTLATIGRHKGEDLVGIFSYLAVTLVVMTRVIANIGFSLKARQDYFGRQIMLIGILFSQGISTFGATGHYFGNTNRYILA